MRRVREWGRNAWLSLQDILDAIQQIQDFSQGLVEI
jgi:hypothetical protein